MQPELSKPTQSRVFGRRPDIQGLRALAVILVIFSHLPSWGKFVGGFVGVDIFFVISGYVITRLLISKHQGADQSSFASNYFSFMWKRIQRLVPALFAMIVSVLALAFLVGPPLEFKLTAKAALWSELFVSNLFFLKNFDSYWNPELLRNPFLHTWSLGIEFQIYLVMPFILIGLLLFGARQRRGFNLSVLLIAVTSILSLVVFLVLVLYSGQISGIDAQGAAFYTPMTRLWEFGAGVLAVLLTLRFEAHGRNAVWFNISGWVLIAAGTIGSHLAGTVSAALVPVVFGTALILFAGEKTATSFTYQLLQQKPFVWTGDRSYSIYLWHWPMLMLALWVLPSIWYAPFLAVIVSVMLAAASYRFLEQKRKKGGVSSPVVTRPWYLRMPRLAIGIPVVIVATLGFSAAGSSNWYTRAHVENFTLPEPPVTANEVQSVMSECEILEQEIHCDFYQEGTPEIVIIGDSLSFRTFPAVALAAKEHGFNASELWQGGCSIEVNSCPPFIQEYLQTNNIAGILVTTNYDRESSLLNAAEAAGGEEIACPDTTTRDCKVHLDAIAKYERDASAGLDWLLSITPNVSVALTFPQQSPETWGSLYPTLINRMEKPEPELGQTPMSWQEERQGLYPETIARVVSTKTGVDLWDPKQFLCSEDRCPGVINGGEQIMDDAIHWSWPASRFLYPPIQSFISRVSSASSTAKEP